MKLLQFIGMVLLGVSLPIGVFLATILVLVQLFGVGGFGV
jgi:hypothetical protein